MSDDRRSFLTKVAAGALGASVQVGASASKVGAWTGLQTNSVLNQARPNDKDSLTIVKIEPMIMRVHEDKQGKLSGTPYMLCRVEGNTDPVLNNKIFPGGWQDSRAFFLPPETPGLGIKFSSDFVRDHAMDLSTAERAG